MLAKIAFRNVKRQAGNYLIYYLTVSLTIALIFAFSNLVFGKELWNHPAALPQMRAGLSAISMLIGLVEAFVLGYASSYLLGLRKQEFGMYLTLGMNRRQILLIFFCEEMLLCAASLITGILGGLLLYQGLMALLTGLMDMPFAFSAYSPQGLLFTVLLVGGMFLLSFIVCSLYLRRATIYRLLFAGRRVERGERRPLLWFVIFLAALAALVTACLWFRRELESLVTDFDTPPGGLFGSLLLGVVSVLFLYMGLGRSAAGLLLRRPKFCCRGTAVFILRQLSGKLKTNALMAGILALLLLLALAATDISFAQYAYYDAILERNFPFAVLGTLEEEEEPAISFSEAEQILAACAPVTSRVSYTLYAGGTSALSEAYLSGERLENGQELQDMLIGESELNRVLAALGEEPVRLDGTYQILSSQQQMESVEFPRISPAWSGKQYPFGGVADLLISLVPDDVMFLVVVPDEALRELSPAWSCCGWQLENTDFDAAALQEALINPQSAAETGYALSSDYQVREYHRIQGLQSMAVLIVSALYMGLIFVLLALAVLALKTLSGLSGDREKYRILSKIGCGEREQKRTLLWQLGVFFFFPLLLPLLMSVPVTWICVRFVSLAGFPQQAARTAMYGTAAAVVLAAAYGLYFLVSWLIAARQVIVQD